MTKVILVFDDGFAKSCLQIAEIFEARDWSASFAVLVDSSTIYPDTPKGDFLLWNQLQERGHIIEPHGYDHADLSKIPFEEAISKIDACLDYFADHLRGFDQHSVTYHLTYNRSTPEVDDYLLSKVKAIRTTGPQGNVGSGMNNKKEQTQRIYNCAWHGPDNCDAHLMDTLRLAEAEKPTILVYMLHGLDDEGWGPIHGYALEKALDYIAQSPELEYADTSFL